MSLAIAPGFENPPLQSQAVFRAVLAAMAEPGRVFPCLALAVPLPPVLAAVALTLLDYETPMFLAGGLASEETRQFLAFHTGAPLVEVENAAFVLALDANDLPSVTALRAGTPDYPDRSATVILNTAGFDDGMPVSLKGPGIACERIFRVKGLSAAFWEAAAANAARFPLGVDFIFCGPDSVAALPRSTVPARI